MLSSPTKLFLNILFIFFSFAILAGAQTPTPTPSEQEDTERIFTEEIKLNVTAFDSDGRFVGDVKKEDLVITEDGRLNQANSIRRIPANVLIVMDTGGELRAAKSFKQTVNTTKSLIDALAAEDLVAIMQYHDKVEIIAEWTNKAEALKILDIKANFGKRSVFVKALDIATKFLQKTPLENRHLVLITDGTDSFNNLTERDAAMKNLLATNINVHVISYTSLEKAEIAPKTKILKGGEHKPQRLPEEVIIAMPKPIQDLMRAPRLGSINTDREFIRKMKEREKSLVASEKYLAALSADTNGEFILPATKEEMLEKTALVARFVDSNYVITYTPKRALKDSPTGEVRSIEVSSRRPNLQVVARRKLLVLPN
jgi:VWFA-related protein